MSRLFRSPNSRYWAMQLFLCLVLGGTLLLAAVVSHRISARRDVRFEKVAEFGPFLLQRPVPWTERYTQDGVIFEDLSQRGRPRRRIEIWTAFTPVFLSPLEFIARSEDPRLTDVAPLIARAEGGDLHTATAPLILAGWNGLLLSPRRLAPPVNAQPPNATEWRTYVACTLLPSGRMLLVRLEGEALDDRDADHLLRKMGRTLRLVEHDFAVSNKPLPLDDWTTLTIPPRFATFGKQEDLRASRLLISTDEGQPWLAADVVPCVVRPREDPARVLPSLMTLRDPLFRANQVEQLDDRTWTCRRADERHPSAVFWHDLGDGRGTLVEFRWTAGGDTEQEEIRLREAWAQIVENLEAAETQVPAAMVERGLEVGRHLPMNAAFLLERAAPVERWQWYHEAVSRQTQTTFRYGQDGQIIRGTWESDHVPPLTTTGGREQGWFWLATDWNRYRSLVARSNPNVLSQTSRMVLGKLRTAVMAGREAVGEREESIDASFVPGSVFMLALGALPAEPTVLTTDWLINPTCAASASPLTLVLTPVSSKVQVTLPPTTATTTPVGRVWEVRINGRSFASRWQLDEQGRVESVTFGGNVRLRRLKTEEGEVEEPEKAEELKEEQGDRK